MDHLQVPKSSGIYQIKNTVSRKSYIGSAISLRRRCWYHTRHLNVGNHDNSRLQYAWRKHGKEAFEFIVLEEGLDKDKLIEREQFFLDVLIPEYNLCGTAGSTLGRTHGPEAREKISKAGKGKVITPECRAKISLTSKGRKYSPESSEKKRQALLGRKRSPEVREKVRLANQTPEAREKNRQAHLGRKHTPEAKRKMSDANHERVCSPETRAKRRQNRLGKKHSPKTREKISNAHRGRKRTPEHCAALKLAWQRRKAAQNLDS